MKTRSITAKEKTIVCGGVAGILGLPEALFWVIDEFCPIFQLLGTNRLFFFSVKRNRHYYRLNREFSKTYQKSEAFRDAVKGRMKDMSKQLYLNLSWCNNITDVSGLGGVHTLNLVGCTNITDVSALGGVHTLNLVD